MVLTVIPHICLPSLSRLRVAPEVSYPVDTEKRRRVGVDVK